jgi:asparagine synthetase B (glutamine-hydrolysing)
MCSFILLYSQFAPNDQLLSLANRYSRFRGPDRTTVIRKVVRTGWHLTLLHNLLDISGTAAAQPIVDQSGTHCLMAVFNGEIYNYRQLGDYRCDTDCILPTYSKAGSDMARRLDGEFSIVNWDERRSVVTIAVDPFLTKPLYWAVDNQTGHFGVATCASSLRELGLQNVILMKANAAIEICFAPEGLIVNETPNSFQFSIEQTADSYHGWTAAFLNAVSKRALHGSHRPVVYLSSGYDSGAICAALNHLGISYDTFSIVAGENRELLNQRIEVNRSAVGAHAFVSRGLSRADAERVRSEICASVEPFVYMHEDQPGCIGSLQNDGGAIGAYFLAEWARREGRVVNLSGAGADEIISDYGWNGNKFYYHSQFGGLFPQTLEEFFPWKKFYNDTQRSYLFKDEYILGRHGIEGRYPFLDRRVVQEFLKLRPELKNRCYKAPIEQFLQQCKYPFEPARKRGFSPTLDQQATSAWRKLLSSLRILPK